MGPTNTGASEETLERSATGGPGKETETDTVHADNRDLTPEDLRYYDNLRYYDKCIVMRL